jgi:hypothetical protein
LLAKISNHLKTFLSVKQPLGTSPHMDPEPLATTAQSGWYPLYPLQRNHAIGAKCSSGDSTQLWVWKKVEKKN